MPGRFTSTQERDDETATHLLVYRSRHPAMGRDSFRYVLIQGWVIGR
ncbi:Uncharacterised protein [Mycobacterium tuberculosis]|nr:Uncharacterised protein [Mycobacterium tuberculosis]CKP11839.1 Uncharacterised protein [Mycobacterium tuberculosis]CKW17539.1 Uncharacterised protein [Mycobacterium tuberculosis]CKW22372.1 Uncharacterised protein [Mycobacterium tuberculosis]CKW66476.1 Uncharacterised protein [Mycobacterium tuberculosis]